MTWHAHIDPSCPHGWHVRLDGTKVPLLPPAVHGKTAWLIGLSVEKKLAGEETDRLVFIHPDGTLSESITPPTRDSLIAGAMWLRTQRFEKSINRDGTAHYEVVLDPPKTRAEAEADVDAFLGLKASEVAA